MAINLSPLDKACAASSAVTGAAIDALIELDNRFSALRRTVNILRGSADLLTDFTLPYLPSISEVDLSTYNSLRSACPMLNLPLLDESLFNLPGLQQLGALRRSLLEAYDGFLDGIENSALGAIDQLQRQLDRLAAEALAKAGPVMDLIDCICQGSATLRDAATVQRAKDTYESWKSPAKPTLIDDQISAQRDQMNAAKAQLKKAML